MIRIDAAQVGERVVVRYLLDDGRATDVVGELTALDGGQVVVLPDDAPPVAVPRGALVAAKPVPPRRVTPSSRPDVVERVLVAGWPGLEMQRLGGWLLRAAGGFTRRANSALAAGDPGVDLDNALDAVRRFYDERGLPASVQALSPLTGDDRWPADGWYEQVTRRGWTPDDGTLVMTTDLRAVRSAPQLPTGYRLDTAPEPDDAWLGLYRYRGTSLPPVARQVLLAAPWQLFASIRAGDDTVAVGRVAVARGWAGIAAMQVAEAHRRRGLARTLLLALLDAGRAHGGRYGYLQVAASNTAGRALYAATGFTPHHAYHYLAPPPTSVP